MTIIWTILIGFVVGLAARFVMPGRDKMGFIMTTLLGIGGAVLAGYAAPRLGFHFHGQLAAFVAAVAGALVILFLYNAISRRS